MKLADMLENRHTMSQTVRAEVSPKSQEWGYKLDPPTSARCTFRDAGMIRQIEEKVVNRLRQVTSSIRQEGANQVSVITSTAEREAAIEFAKARALRPRIVGAALQEISRDPDIAGALFEILEIEKLREGKPDLVLIPRNRPILKEWLAPPRPRRNREPDGAPLRMCARSSGLGLSGFGRDFPGGFSSFPTAWPSSSPRAPQPRTARSPASLSCAAPAAPNSRVFIGHAGA